MSPNQRGWGEDAFIGRPYNPRDSHSHPRLTGTEEVEGGLPKRAAHATSMTHMVLFRRGSPKTLLLKVIRSNVEPKLKGLRGGHLYRTPMQPSWPTRSPQTHLTQRGGGRTPQMGSPCDLHDPHGHLSKRRVEWEEDPPKRGSMHPHCPHSTPKWPNHPKKAKKALKKKENSEPS
jgi:hypothetical protein